MAMTLLSITSLVMIWLLIAVVGLSWFDALQDVIHYGVGVPQEGGLALIGLPHTIPLAGKGLKVVLPGPPILWLHGLEDWQLASVTLLLDL